MSESVFCRMVLGSGDCSSGPRCSSGGVRRGIFGTGQQPPPVHAHPLSQDCTGSHQYTDTVQQSPVSARLHFPSPAQPLFLSQRAQPGAVLHGTKAERRGREGGGGGPVQILAADNPGHICVIKTEAGHLQAPEPPVFTAPHPPRYQQAL